MVEAAPELAAGGPRLRLTHQTGERDVEMVRAAYGAAGLQADVEPFFYDMGRRVASGGPDRLPRGSDDDRRDRGGREAGDSDSAADGDRRSPARNAEALASAGAAEMLLQADATGAVLAGRILALAGDRERERGCRPRRERSRGPTRRG